MCTFTFCYKDGKQNVFENIVRVQYTQAGFSNEIEEKELLTYCFPTNATYHLFSDSTNYTVSGKDLSYIEVQEENYIELQED